MRPPLFADLEFDDALARSKVEGKLLLADATASWCSPCQQMDRATWVEPSVVRAVGAHAIAVQIDVDQRREVAQKLAIKAMPTVVAFRDGVEIDRVVGMQSPTALVGWVEALARGETSLDRARVAVRASPTDIKPRLDLAQKLLQTGSLDEATSELLWLWEHMLEHEPALVVVRHSFFLGTLRELAARHVPAREALTRLRDAIAPPADDWFSLNTVLGDDARTFAWFDGLGEHTKDAALAQAIESRVIPLLCAAGRWADAGRAYAAPLATFASIAKRHVEGKRAVEQVGDGAAAIVQAMEDITKKAIGDLCRALREGKRDDDLRAVEDAAKKMSHLEAHLH